jgi:hypothetical protein
MAADRAHLRRFGLVVGGALVAIAAYLLFRGRAPIGRWVAGGLGAPLLALALLRPAWLAPVERAWMAVAAVLGWVNTRILLSVLFFVVLTPISLVGRLFGRDPLARRRGAGRTSYWQTRTDEKQDEQRYRRPY